MVPEPARFGKYLLLRRVAVGGMAEIYLALEEIPHAGCRFVTIKRIRPDLAHDRDFIDFFLSESRVALKCSHPNLPQTFDLGVVDGVHYLAMEFIRGHTLLDVIRRTYMQSQVVSVGTAVAVGIQIAAALEHAHGLTDVDGKPMEVIHRDVTPQNIMVSTGGIAKLIDFGIVRASVQAHQTRAGTVKGKFSYMAPEQLAGPDHIDQRCDIFALGVCLHETLSGRALFRGKSDADTLRRIRSAEVPDLSQHRADVPPQLSAVILKALERQPQRRFQSATELLAALEEVSEECGIYRSVTRTRDEVLERCGDPPMPTLDAATSRALTQAAERGSTAEVVAVASASLPAIPTAVVPGPPGDVSQRAVAVSGEVEVAASGEVADAASDPPADAAPADAPTAETTGIAGDRDLLYFLQKAGSNVPEHLRSTDPELAALLARAGS